MNITESSFIIKKDLAPKDYGKLSRKVSDLPGVLQCHKTPDFHSLFIAYDSEICPEEEINALISMDDKETHARAGLMLSLVLSFVATLAVSMVF